MMVFSGSGGVEWPGGSQGAAQRTCGKWHPMGLWKSKECSMCRAQVPRSTTSGASGPAPSAGALLGRTDTYHVLCHHAALPLSASTALMLSSTG